MVATAMALLVLLATQRTPSPPPPRNPLQAEVAASRQFRQAGVVAGGTVFAAAALVGVAGGLIDLGPDLLLTVAAAALGAAVHTSSFDEDGPPLPESSFEVRESEIEGAGMGLFSAAPIPSGAFLFPYEGEALTESEYFARYEDGRGRYVAEVPSAPWGGDPVYIDGADPDKSGLARYMNSKPEKDGANVIWRKQRFGTQAGSMYFYASKDVYPGEELCFDYGEQYWGVVRDKEGC